MLSTSNETSHRLTLPGRLLRRRRLTQRRGAAAVEFALVFPCMLLMVWGIIEFGQVLSAHQLLINGARIGARRAIMPAATDTQAKAAIDDYLQTVGIYSGYTRTVVPTTNSAKSGDMITVTITIPYGSICKLPDMVGLGGTTMKAVVIMRKE